MLRFGVSERTRAAGGRTEELEQHHLIGPGVQQGAWYVRGHLGAYGRPVPAQVEVVYPHQSLPAGAHGGVSTTLLPQPVSPEIDVATRPAFGDSHANGSHTRPV